MMEILFHTQFMMNLIFINQIKRAGTWVREKINNTNIILGLVSIVKRFLGRQGNGVGFVVNATISIRGVYKNEDYEIRNE